MSTLTRARLVLCSTIVAAFHIQIAARSAVVEDVPVPGGTVAFARALGIDPVPDRARFAAELTRLAIDRPALNAFLAHRPAAGDLIPVPLSASVWGQAVFHRSIAGADLFAAIVGDQRASFVCHALAALDDETLQVFADHPALLQHVYENRAGVFAAFGGSLRVKNGRVVTPGGAAGVALWESALQQTVDRPERFIQELMDRDKGRVAYVYDILAQLDASKTAFALGLWIADRRVRTDRFNALLSATTAVASEWDLNTRPFTRPLDDIALLLARVRTDAAGAPVLGSRLFWMRVFENTTLSRDPAMLLKLSGEDSPIDAATLVELIFNRTVRERDDRAAQFAFGQRVFAPLREWALPDALVALRALGRYRMLMLSLERIGITDPAVFAAAARQAERLSALPPNQGFVPLAQFQGALALLTRMTRVHTIDIAGARELVSKLVAVPLSAGRYDGGVVRWIDAALRPALAPSSDAESALLSALAGESVADRRALAPVAWEGQTYRFDLAGAELRRLRRIRDKQAGYGVDLASALDAAARPLAGPAVTAADIQTSIARLKELAAEFAPAARSDRTDARDACERAIRSLAGMQASPDARGAGRVSHAIDDLADTVLAEALLSLTYAVEIADPDSTLLLAGNVALRHDFGLRSGDLPTRTRIEWGLPKQEIMPATPWHVSGSLLGLDIALAPLSLRRLTFDHAVAPDMVSNERETFAISVALMNPVALSDSDRDLILGAVDRGRERIAALTPEQFDAAAEEIGMDGWRRRAAHWTLANDPALLPSLFSLTELLHLGGGAESAALDAWGMSAIVLEGCLCARFTPPGRWTLWTGHPQFGLIGANVTDLNLQIAAMLRDLHLPAALTVYVLTAAVQDFIDEVRLTDPDDWLTLVRAARQVSRERVEDYVAAAAADGPLVPESRAASGGSPESSRWPW